MPDTSYGCSHSTCSLPSKARAPWATFSFAPSANSGRVRPAQPKPQSSVTREPLRSAARRGGRKLAVGRAHQRRAAASRPPWGGRGPRLAAATVVARKMSSRHTALPTAHIARLRAEIGSGYSQETSSRVWFLPSATGVLGASREMPRSRAGDVAANARWQAGASSGLRRPRRCSKPWTPPAPRVGGCCGPVRWCARPTASSTASPRLLNAASRVTLLCGSGCGGRTRRAVGARREAEVAHGGTRFEARSMSSGTTRTTVGMTGLIGFGSGYYAMRDCDALAHARPPTSLPAVLSRGPRAHGPGRHPPENLGRRAPIELGLVGDVAATIPSASCPASTRRPTSRISTTRGVTIAKRARTSTISRTQAPEGN